MYLYHKHELVIPAEELFFITRPHTPIDLQDPRCLSHRDPLLTNPTETNNYFSMEYQLISNVFSDYSAELQEMLSASRIPPSAV